MDINLLISKALENNQVLKLLRGESEYEIPVSKFTSDIFPTDINYVLVNCFYKKVGCINYIDEIFSNALEELINSNASDLYISLLYFDACVYYEEKEIATFKIDKEYFTKLFRVNLYEKENELKNDIIFSNGMIKNNSWKNIENFNNYYKCKFNISII